MLRDPADAAALKQDSGLGSPYVDPRLRFRPREYADFLLRLDRAGMLEWEVAERQATFSTGFFFVEKSNGVNLRLVFDTRVANMSFTTPPSTRLPTPSAWSSLEAASDFYTAQGDIQCAFYHMKLPSHLHRYFSLPVVPNRYLGFKQLCGTKLGTNCFLQPFVCVMPMGWSWALHLRQKFLESAID